MQGFFGTTYTTRLVNDWADDDGNFDESTNLALLDIYVLVLWSGILAKDDLKGMGPWLRDAHSLADSIRRNHPGCMRSRTFAQWIVVKTAESKLRLGVGRADDVFQGFPGMTTSWNGTGLIPVYVPSSKENPHWRTTEGLIETKAPLEMALKLARQLEDHQTQRLCLELLIVNSHDPATHFEELSRMQIAQGDRHGFLWSSMSRYLLCRDRRSQKQLLDDLNGFSEWTNPHTLFDPEAYWARDLIRGALSEILGADRVWTRAAEAFRIYEDLISPSKSAFMRRLLAEHGEIPDSDTPQGSEYARDPERGDGRGAERDDSRRDGGKDRESGDTVNGAPKQRHRKGRERGVRFEEQRLQADERPKERHQAEPGPDDTDVDAFSSVDYLDDSNEYPRRGHTRILSKKVNEHVLADLGYNWTVSVSRGGDPRFRRLIN
jgi:hypothetical protein